MLDLTDGASLAVDFTAASGADAMLVYTGRAEGIPVGLGGRTLTFKFLTSGQEPQPKVEGGKVVVGKQTVALDNGGSLVLGVCGR